LPSCTGIKRGWGQYQSQYLQSFDSSEFCKKENISHIIYIQCNLGKGGYDAGGYGMHNIHCGMTPNLTEMILKAMHKLPEMLTL